MATGDFAELVSMQLLHETVEIVYLLCMGLASTRSLVPPLVGSLAVHLRGLPWNRAVIPAKSRQKSHQNTPRASTPELPGFRLAPFVTRVAFSCIGLDPWKPHAEKIFGSLMQERAPKPPWIVLLQFSRFPCTGHLDTGFPADRGSLEMRSWIKVRSLSARGSRPKHRGSPMNESPSPVNRPA